MNLIMLNTLVFFIFVSGTTSFVLRSLNKPIIFRNQNSLQLNDIPLIPTIIGATVIVFGVFNIENPVDLTDQGVVILNLGVAI